SPPIAPGAQFQFAVMEGHHRFGEAETKAGSRLVPALFEPDEPLRRLVALIFRNAWPVIDHRETDISRFAGQRNKDGRLLPGTGRVFDGIVDDVGKRLRQQLAVTVDFHLSRYLRF